MSVPGDAFAGGLDRRTRRVAGVLGALLVAYYVVPVVGLFLAQSPDAVFARLRDPVVVHAAETSVGAATVTTMVATVLGVPFAYWLSRTAGRVRTAATGLVVLPLVLPPIVSGMVVLAVVGPGAPLGRLLVVLGVQPTGSFLGIVLAQLFVASPFVVVTATAAFDGVDARYEAASRTLGTSRLRTLRRITLPLAWPGVLAGMTLTFARSLGEFGATFMLAYYPKTLPIETWSSFNALGLDAAFPVAVVLVLVAVATIATLNVLGSEPWS